MTKRDWIILAVALLIGTAFWLVDTVSLNLSSNDLGFSDALVVSTPVHHFVLRSVMLGFSLFGGFVVSKLFRRIVQGVDDLERIKNRLATAFDSIADGVITTDIDLNILISNKVARRILGMQRHGHVGENLVDVLTTKRVSGADSPLTKIAKDVVATGEVGHIPQIEYTNAQGAEKMLENSISPIISSEGAIEGLVFVFRDITQRIRDEQKAKALENQLAHFSKMEAIGQLSGGIAHNFNNILMGISGTAELMEGDFHAKPGCDPQVIEGLKSIRDGVARAAVLTKKLMALSKNDMVDIRMIDIRAAITDFRDMLVKGMGGTIQLQFDLNSTWLIKADKSQIEQVLLNLAINSKDAILFNRGAEEKAVRIETSNADLNEEFASSHAGLKSGRYVRLAFSDTGIGMSREVRERIFEPFFTTKESGTGLGLYSVYGIIEGNKAAIFVESEVGKGTSFNIYWPATDASLDPLSRERSTPQDELRGAETILLVEGEDQIRRLAKEYLSRLGYTVIEAASAAEAMARLDAKIDVVITNVILPKMDGFDMVDKIKETLPEVKVLFTSAGYTDAYMKGHGKAESGVEFIAKPYGLVKLAEKIRAILPK